MKSFLPVRGTRSLLPSVPAAAGLREAAQNLPVCPVASTYLPAAPVFWHLPAAAKGSQCAPLSPQWPAYMTRIPDPNLSARQTARIEMCATARLDPAEAACLCDPNTRSQPFCPTDCPGRNS
ncbi:unnamed protein product [Calypogeia fissa]